MTNVMIISDKFGKCTLLQKAWQLESCNTVHNHILLCNRGLGGGRVGGRLVDRDEGDGSGGNDDRGDNSKENEGRSGSGGSGTGGHSKSGGEASAAGGSGNHGNDKGNGSDNNRDELDQIPGPTSCSSTFRRHSKDSICVK